MVRSLAVMRHARRVPSCGQGRCLLRAAILCSLALPQSLRAAQRTLLRAPAFARPSSTPSLVVARQTRRGTSLAGASWGGGYARATLVAAGQRRAAEAGAALETRLLREQAA
eukprot:CAMPEP_0168438392 /NCGR_PEP_ID=MMETSP0228-20121227/41937_1 /TAXON_ID=133427 /ORGANISM="Protoceratium reticulatum, Strain CCCM 535 (=CCMP 1889)" /LENGTH=111 /DNA_ID=CAMNT_0008452657 /DNA_START=77 /DNA_END=408 /DNA_ORIENTATION=+